MNTETILGAIIVLLFGIIAGGAGGQAIIKRTIGNITQSESGTTTAASAAAAAASAAATAAASLNSHVASLQVLVAKQGDTLNSIVLQQARMATNLEQFPEFCKLKHEAIDREQARLQVEIDNLREK